MIHPLLGWLGSLLLTELPSTSDDVPVLRVSDRFPNVPISDHLGNALRFRDAFVTPGRALVVSSMYTTCRGSCPSTNVTVAKLRRRLWPVFKDSLEFVSFTREPQVDNIKRLADYAEAYDAGVNQTGMCNWRFITGAVADLDELRRALGFYDLNPQVDADITQHGTTLLVGNPRADKWSAHEAELPFELLVTTIRRVAGFTFEQRYGIRPS